MIKNNKTRNIVKALHKKGWKVDEISYQLKLNRVTIRRILKLDNKSK